MQTTSYKDLFLSEAREILGDLNANLLKLEKNSKDNECLNQIFRNAHTLKGIANIMRYDSITKLAHEMESFLDLLRQGKVKHDKKTMDDLFRWCDGLEKLVEQVATSDQAAAEIEALPKKQEVQTVRVAMDQLDRIMDMVGEIVIHKARFAEAGKRLEDRCLDEAVTELERMTNKLQGDMMQVRLVPIDYIFNRFPRMVRDQASKEKKSVDLVIEGAEIGLDRTILDEINEPLVHLLRNAVSHGIETPEERKKAGKPATGTIHFTAWRERHSVMIEIRDDGRGIDIEEVKKQALEKRIIPESEAIRLTEEEALMLITSPAFSTTMVVTETSGRGFGMNAVKTIVESLGGSLRIRSTRGQGTQFTLTLPLSLAIVHALLVQLGPEIYAVPLANINETLKVNASLIRRFENQEMVPYRETVLPLIRLAERFGLKPKGIGGESSLPVVVVEIGSHRAGLIVDQLTGQQEIVIKSLKHSLKSVKGISGATILGNGRVAMIVDVASLLS